VAVVYEKDYTAGMNYQPWPWNFNCGHRYPWTYEMGFPKRCAKKLNSNVNEEFADGDTATLEVAGTTVNYYFQKESWSEPQKIYTSTVPIDFSLKPILVYNAYETNAEIMDVKFCYT